MTFAAPLWLLGLLPWSAVVAYLLWGRRPRVDVPFLELWPQRDEGIRVKRRATPPPVALALAILATLLGILAAGRPTLAGGGSASSIAVILDCGYTMSASAPRAAGDPGTRLDAMRATLPDLRARYATVPELPLDDIRPTALDTRNALHAAVRKALGDSAGGVLVVSDQEVGIKDDRLVQASPESPMRNARIVLMAARETPSPQVMVRIRGGRGFGPATLRVSSGEHDLERDVEVNDDGERDEFFNVRELAQVVKAELVVGDHQPADNVAWLVRESSWPRIEARAPLPAHVQRMVDVYARQRPPTDASRRVVIAAAVEQLPAGGPGVILAPTGTSAGAPAKLNVVDHPVNAGLTWKDVGAPTVASSSASPQGWTPIVTADGETWVAAREQPQRAVWIGFDGLEWSRSSEFVVFWANVLTWVGAGGERFASHPVGSLDADSDWTPVELAPSITPPEQELWPGLYRRTDGTLRALHAPDVPIPTVKSADWQQRLAQWRDTTQSRVQLAPWFAATSLLCLALAALLWKRRDPSQGRSKGWLDSVLGRS